MPSTPPISPKSFLRLSICVCVASTLVAGFMGLLATLMYLRFQNDRGYLPPRFTGATGILSGAASGLLAGVIWCRLMILLAKSPHRRRLEWWGALIGLVVGSLSTVLLHLGLMWTADEWHPDYIAFGLQFGVPIGAVLGAISGYALRRAADAASDDAATVRTDAMELRTDTEG